MIIILFSLLLIILSYFLFKKKNRNKNKKILNDKSFLNKTTEDNNEESVKNKELEEKERKKKEEENFKMKELEKKEKEKILMKYLSKKENPSKYLIEEEKESKIKLNPLSLQLQLKFNFKCDKNDNLYINEDTNKIIILHELSNKNIGILFSSKLGIYSINTFKLICNITPNVNVCNLNLINFIELKNNDIIIWSQRTILLFYKLSYKEYKQYQIINEYTLSPYFSYDLYSSYNINSIYQLKNGLLISCNSYGLYFYYKKDNKYILLSKHEISIEVENIIEIKENVLVLIQRYHEPGRGCIIGNRTPGKYHYSISIYNIETKEEKILNKYSKYKYENFSDSGITYLVKNRYLFIRYIDHFFIYDIKQNMKLINKDKENEGGEIIKVLKNEMRINFLCNYFDKFILVRDLFDKKIKIYIFNGESLKYYKDFPFDNKNNGITKLANNDIIMYSSNSFSLLKICN